ncbi:hypothetical protein MUK42_01581 [Musa troglodytarum]|nr:hypothetical protein MUK42_01581 [Musa troglodytarum]
MASSARAFGAVLCRVSLSQGLSSLRNSLSLQGIGLLGSRLPSALPKEARNTQTVRKIWTSRPVCMGRRSCKIAGRKDAQNLKKMKRNSKIGKEIVAAIQKGGPNPNSNTVLAAILDKARVLDVPKEIVERNIKKASEKGQEAYIEKFYEVYGFGGVGMVVEVLTDKVTRSVAAVRGIIKDSGAKLADPGSILFKFRRVRVVNIKANAADKDQLLSIALDAGAEDVIEPAEDEDDLEEDRPDR